MLAKTHSFDCGGSDNPISFWRRKQNKLRSDSRDMARTSASILFRNKINLDRSASGSQIEDYRSSFYGMFQADKTYFGKIFLLFYRAEI